MIDSHAHIHSKEFDADRDAVLERAGRAGVTAILAVGEDLADNERVLSIAAETPQIQPCLGLHPDRFQAFRLQEVLAQIRAHGEVLVAIGEVGLDYWRAKEDEERRTQRDALAAMAGLADELDVPVNVHSRSAGHHTLALLGELGTRRVHMHAFDGKVGHAMRAAERGVFFSIPPSVLRSVQKQKLVKRLPVEQMLLESDAPVLGPTADTRNEPANLRLTLEYIAAERGIPILELEETLVANTLEAYPRLKC